MCGSWGWGLFQWCITCNRSFRKSSERADPGHAGPCGMGGLLQATTVPPCAPWQELSGLQGALWPGQSRRTARLLKQSIIPHFSHRLTLLKKKNYDSERSQVNLRKPNFLMGYLGLDVPDPLATSTQKSKCNVVSELQSALHKTTGKCRCLIALCAQRDVGLSWKDITHPLFARDHYFHYRCITC